MRRRAETAADQRARQMAARVPKSDEECAAIFARIAAIDSGRDAARERVLSLLASPDADPNADPEWGGKLRWQMDRVGHLDLMRTAEMKPPIRWPLTLGLRGHPMNRKLWGDCAWRLNWRPPYFTSSGIAELIRHERGRGLNSGCQWTMSGVQQGKGDEQGERDSAKGDSRREGATPDRGIAPKGQGERAFRRLGGEKFIAWEGHSVCARATGAWDRCSRSCARPCAAPDLHARQQAWLAQELCLHAAHIRRQFQGGDTRAHQILDRLTTDARAAGVWDDLTKRDLKTGKFLYDLKPPTQFERGDFCELEKRSISLGCILFEACFNAVTGIAVTTHQKQRENYLSSINHDPHYAALIDTYIPKNSIYYVDRSTKYDSEARAMSISMLVTLHKITGRACPGHAKTLASAALGRPTPELVPAKFLTLSAGGGGGASA